MADYGIFIGLKILGVLLYVCIWAVKRGRAPVFLQQWCSLTPTTDCLRVIRSRPLGIVDMAEVGMVYFVGGLLVLLSGLVGIGSRENTVILYGLSWLSIPYLLFSLYYQYAVVGKWCTLCLSVWCVMVAEILLSLHDGMTLARPLLSYGKNILFVCAVFLFTAVVWGVFSRISRVRRQG